MPLPASEKPPATRIVIGAGDGSDFTRVATERSILVEPAPDAAAALSRRFADLDSVTVMPVAVSSGDDTVPLQVFNAPSLSSLRMPTGLKEIMPGLKTVSTPRVPVLSVNSLLEKIGEIARPLHLVLDAPGGELDILEGWKAAGALDLIDCLDLHCTREVMYEGAADLDRLQAWLAAEAFQVSGTDDTDPDWPVLRLSPDRTKRALALLQKKLDAAEARAVKAEAERDALKKAKEAQDKTLADLTATAETRQNRIAELEPQLAEQTEARTAAEKTATARGTELEALKKAQDELARAKEAQDKTLSDLTATAETRQNRIAELELQLAKQTEARTAAEKTATARGTELETLKKAKDELAKAKEAQAKTLAELTALSGTRHRRLGESEAEIAELSKQRDALKKQANDSASEAATARQRAAELERKLVLARDDLLRADGQVGLIKELLLDGNSL